MKKIFAGCAAAALMTLSAQAGATLTVNVYANSAASIAGVKSAVANRAPTATIETSVVDFWDGSGSAGNYGNNFAFPGGLTDYFGMHVTGLFDVTTAGNYTFRTYADDGVELAIDGVTLFTDSTYHPPAYFSKTVNLTAGRHSLELFYFENAGGASVELDAAFQNQPYALIGAANGLQTAKVPEPDALALMGLGLLGLVARRKRSA